MKIKVTGKVINGNPALTVGSVHDVTLVNRDGVRVNLPWGNHVPTYAYDILDGNVTPKVEKVTAHNLSKPVVKRSKRAFSAGYKQRILAEYETLGYGEKGALLAREGLKAEHIYYWRTQSKQGHFSTDRIVSFHRGDSIVE